MSEIKAYAAYEAKGQLKPFAYVPRPLGEEDVEIRITHCGICSSDLHTIDSGWGPSTYPGTVPSLFSRSDRVVRLTFLLALQWCRDMRLSEKLSPQAPK